MIHAFFFSLLFATLFSTNVFASSSKVEQDDAIKHAKEIALWQKTEWLNLLHYNKEYNRYVSQVDDQRYFYSEDGRTNPESELISTIKHLFIPKENHNQQTQCQFVARSQWLLEQLKINTAYLPIVHCDEYLEWRGLIQADSVTLIFPAYHLNSPSSMFGHTLLRLDKSGEAKSEWLSYAVNFGANVDDDDNSFEYAYRGLAGGYPGIFITEPYFKKIQEYNRIEHRDIWEYKLNLTANETEKMTSHLWELKNINFDYYFFDENCSYRLLELLEVARPGIELTDEFTVTAIPVDTVRAIKKAKLIASSNYRPAQATEIQFQLDTMPKRDREIVLKLSKDISITESKAFKNHTMQEQKKITKLAYDYLRYENTKEQRNATIAKRSFQLLQKINSYPKANKTHIKINKPIAPEQSHKSRRISLAAGKRANKKYAALDFKMSFHDLEDNVKGFLQGAQINIASLQLRAEEHIGLRLHQLDLVDIFSLTPRNRFFKPLSWKVSTGLDKQITKNKDQLTYHVTGGAGATWKVIDDHQIYVLAIGRLEFNKQLKNTLEPAIGFNTGLLSHFKSTTARLEISGEQFEDNIHRLRIQYIQNYALSTNHSIKLFAKHQWQNSDIEFSDVNLSYQYYF